MRRFLIGVGCDAYSFFEPLAGAQNDARNIYSALVTGTPDSYEDVSVLLESPTLSELQLALRQFDPPSGGIDVLTFYFAGHGLIRAGSFWMCLRDTQPDRVSATGYSLSNLLLFVQELAPRQANIIIDACESGGVLPDIRSALRAAEIGDSGSIGISLLAACARDQYAFEIDSSGVCTRAILECARGQVYVQSSYPHLDLSDVARKLANTGLPDQDPAFWGLNLSGSGQFCTNPYYQGDRTEFDAPIVTAGAAFTVAEQQKLLSLYSLDDWESQTFASELNELFERHPLSAGDCLHLSRQLSISFRLRARHNADPFHQIEVRAACLSPLLSHSATSQVSDYILEECEFIAKSIAEGLEDVVRALGEDEQALLGQSAHAELFYLPLRISKLLGWVGWLLLYPPSGNPAGADIVAAASDLVRRILGTYPLCCSALTDQQAPYFVLALGGFWSAGLKEEAEELYSLMLASFCEVSGKILPYSPVPSNIVRYLALRAEGDFRECAEIIANPSELGAALFRVADVIGFQEVVDDAMIDLDRRSLSAFLPSSYMDYSTGRILAGTNHTFRIGFDVWQMEQFRRQWPAESAPENESVARLSGLCSLLLADRVCWHVLSSGRTALERLSNIVITHAQE